MKKQTKQAEIVTRTLLKKRYGAHVETVLHTHLQRLPRKKGEITKYAVLLPLPTVAEFEAARAKHFTTTVAELVDEAFSEIESLASEMQEWYDNLPESFQNGDKGSALEEARDALESIDKPDITVNEKAESIYTDIATIAGKLTIVYIPSEGIESRADRAGNASRQLSSAAEAVRDESERKEDHDDYPDGKLVHDAEINDALEELAGELETAAGDLDNIEFPGMY